MPTLTDIVAKIDRKYPNGATTDAKVKIIDNLQKRLYRKFRIPTKVTYDVLGGVYEVNVGIRPVMIYDVLVDGVRYPKKTLLGRTTDASRYHYFIADFLGVYPTPADDWELSVYHYDSPTTLSSSTMSAIPSLDDDFHDIFVHGTCKELSEDDQRYDVASGFSIQYTELEDELSELFKILPEVQTIQVESGW